MKSVIKVVSIAIGIVCFTAGLFFLRTQSASVPDFDTRATVQGAPETVIEIPQGSSGSSIAKLLFKNGVIKSSESFFRVAVGDKRSNKISPGRHTLTLAISARQALEQLLDTNRIPNLIKVSEGAWKTEVIEKLINYGFSSAEVNQAIDLVVLPKGFTDIEGLLFPAQYSFEEGIAATKVLQTMIDRFTRDAASQDILKGVKDFSPLQLLTMASIIQAEGNESDFPKISSVIRNRLKIGMPLQLDSTVHFVKKTRGNIFLSNKSTLVSSPYNTYKRTGLPPGPIGSPGVSAMQAALAPEKGDWLYFITVSPRDTRFTASFDEFSMWKNQYIKNRKAGLFK